MEFVAVRPSDLVDAPPSEFNLFDTLQNGIFNAGKTSRANVGKFMADLVTDSVVWCRWRNSWPHILNATQNSGEEEANEKQKTT